MDPTILAYRDDLSSGPNACAQFRPGSYGNFVSLCGTQRAVVWGRRTRHGRWRPVRPRARGRCGCWLGVPSAAHCASDCIFL